MYVEGAKTNKCRCFFYFAENFCWKAHSFWPIEALDLMLGFLDLRCLSRKGKLGLLFSVIWGYGLWLVMAGGSGFRLLYSMFFEEEI